MTMQSADRVVFEDRQFFLIDCEENNELINSIDRNCVVKWYETSCHRIYCSDYVIKARNLYSASCEFNMDAECHHYEIKCKSNYTGYIVIAGPPNYTMITDVGSICSFEKAYEIGFIDGEVVEITDLKNLINECVGTFINDESETKWKKEPSVMEWHNRKQKIYEYVSARLKGNYSDSCYIWRKLSV